MEVQARDDSPQTVVVIVSVCLLRAAILSGMAAQSLGPDVRQYQERQQGQGLVSGMPVGSTFCP